MTAIATSFMNEVISFGGMPMRRADVYAIVLRDTGSARAADHFAFGPNTRVMADCEPMTIADVDALRSEAA